MKIGHFFTGICQISLATAIFSLATAFEITLFHVFHLKKVIKDVIHPKITSLEMKKAMQRLFKPSDKYHYIAFENIGAVPKRNKTNVF